MKRRPLSQMRAVSLIEPLEDRIAPAGVTVAPNGRSATYTDSTGDKVSVTTTKGKFSSSQFTFDPNTPGQFMELALTGHTDFTGANIRSPCFRRRRQRGRQYRVHRRDESEPRERHGAG